MCLHAPSHNRPKQEATSTDLQTQKTPLSLSPTRHSAGLNLVVTCSVAGQVPTAGNTGLFSYRSPTLTSITPGTGTTAGGTDCVIQGSSFGAAQGTNGGVTIDGVAATIVSWSHTSIAIKTPAGAGKNRAVVVTPNIGTAAGGLTFSYNDPVISSVSPTSGATSGGTLITITGSSLGSFAVGSVKVNGNACTVANAAAYTDTSIICSLPAGQGQSVPLIVTVSGTDSNTLLFSYSNPVITSINPTSRVTGPGTSTLTLTGTSFGTSLGTVSVGGVNCPIVAQSHLEVTCTLQEGQF